MSDEPRILVPADERRCPVCGGDLRDYVETASELEAAARECAELRAVRRFGAPRAEAQRDEGR